MIIEGNDYTTDYFEEADGFRCELKGKNHTDRGTGRGNTKEKAFDNALADYRANRENRENLHVEKGREDTTPT